MKIVAADINNEQAEIALLKVSIDGTRQELFRARYQPADFLSPRYLIERFLSDADATSALIERMCISVAGVVKEGHCQLQSPQWELDAESLQQHFYINEISLISDFDAAARGIEVTPPENLITLNEGIKRERGIRVVTGAGHGLGMAWMDHTQDVFSKNDSEGGQVDFAPVNKEQIELLEYLMEHFNHVSYERILSHKGLLELYAYCKQSDLGACHDMSITKMTQTASDDPAAARALKLFATTYGAYVGNLALLYRPMGGIYIGGRVACELQQWMQSDHFIKACLKKGRMSKLVQQTPIYLVTSACMNLQGAIETATYRY
ncbi:MAG: hypothetical protein CSB47_10230 [Proteobacteria bacterium]|nr:MAG: hypothetical protein CSB47_10230 [Pseudomonadota bacterium]